MHFHLSDLERKQRYKLLAGAIVPRPVALVTTLDDSGHCNAAPFSAFNYMSEDPPLIALGLQVHDDRHERAGQRKDTTRNIIARGDFVVNLMSDSHLDDLVDCAVDFPPDVSETEALGLETAPSQTVRPPRLAACAAALECRTLQILHFSDFRAIVIGEVISIYFRDGIIDPVTLRTDLDAYRPIGRLFGGLYCRTSDIVNRPTPSLKDWQARQQRSATASPSTGA
jgi:2-nitrobenzoate nitroreductase